MDGREVEKRFTTADGLLEALKETGVSYLFCNLGSDHPSLIEALAKAKADNKEVSKVVICPHESVALSAAHGYTLMSGEAQAVIVHTDVGTQNLGGAIHNAFRARIPVFIFAGETPFTTEGELRGTRNSFVNYLQNVYDQRGIVRSYVKWEYDIRTGRNIKQLTYRAMQMANNTPPGPVYLTGAREVLEEEIATTTDESNNWHPIEPNVITEEAAQGIIAAIQEADQPLLITSYLGREKKAVTKLIEFCENLSIPVVEHNPSYMNFPRNHSLHLGYNPNPFIPEADVIIAMDTDVPWVSTQVKTKADCKVYFIDSDPIKEDIPLWHIPTAKNYQADAYRSLQQLIKSTPQNTATEDRVRERHQRIETLHNQQRVSWKENEMPDGSSISPEWLTTCLRKVIDEDTVILDETITSTMAVSKHLPRTKEGTYFGSGGTSLGWNGGAALGMKLADPTKKVVALTGDGTFLFSIPSSVHWMSRRYQAPFLTVIYNNEGWNATKLNHLKWYPDGIAKQSDSYWVNFEQPSELAKIAEAAGGAYAETVTSPYALQEVLQKAMEEVENGRSAVIDVRIGKISHQNGD